MRLLLLCVVAACYHPTPPAGAPCTTNTDCPTELTCSGGHCGGTGSDVDAAIDVPLDGDCVTACSGSMVVGCGVPVSCDLGCSEVGAAHCLVFVPSNGLTPALLVGATTDVPGTQRWTFDTGTGEIRRNATILRHAVGEGLDGGIGFTVVNGIGVFSANSFTVTAGNDWSVTGSRPAALYAATTISVADRIDAGGFFSTPGPGGSSGNTSTMSSSGCRGRAGRLLAVNNGEGGGGGGGATAGGDGGPSSGLGATGLGGSTCTTPATIPLGGGHGGGAGAVDSANNGGAGGGAIALVAMQSIVIAGGGSVGAPGGGGQSATGGEAGGGGGGGGAVLIEAPTVSIHGAITANGGSGAAPTNVNGSRGSVSTATPSVGGSFTGPGGTTTGGSGGAIGAAPGNGGTYTFDNGMGTVIVRGAGGGGAVGRTEIKAHTRDTSGSTQSPTAATSDVVLQ